MRRKTRIKKFKNIGNEGAIKIALHLFISQLDLSKGIFS